MAGITRAEESATRNGINALEMAFSGVQRSRQDVDNTKNNMSAAMKGSDGKAYQDLLTKWDDNAEEISRALRDMINQLNETLTQQGLTQGSSNDAINQKYTQSQQIFDDLVGPTAEIS